MNLFKCDLNSLRDWYNKPFQSLVNYKRVELATFSTLALRNSWDCVILENDIIKRGNMNSYFGNHVKTVMVFELFGF